MNFTPNDSPEKNCLKVSGLPLLCTSNPLKMNSSPIWLPAVFKPNSPIQHVQIVSVSSSLHRLVKLDRDFGAQSLTRVCRGELEQCSLLWTPPCSYIYEWLGLGGEKLQNNDATLKGWFLYGRGWWWRRRGQFILKRWGLVQRVARGLAGPFARESQRTDCRRPRTCGAQTSMQVSSRSCFLKWFLSYLDFRDLEKGLLHGNWIADFFIFLF